MKRIGSSDSLGALISMCPTADEHNMYSRRDYESMLDGLDEEGCVEEGGHVPEKKRRLSVDQVKALERNFEVENKLEPERKVKLAQELGLQPRQVAVWFQNRRARWKTKQLERDYGVLKANFDSLKHNYESLEHDKESLLKEIKELRSKLNEENNLSLSIKEEALLKAEKKSIEETNPTTMAEYFKDGSSDSDSSAILNDDQSPNSSSGLIQNHLMTPNSPCFRFNSDSGSDRSVYHPQLVKMEEHNFFGGDEPCNFFSDEQPPTLHWYSQIPGLDL